ncbi:unnamed protein product [Polarella glacialis]|uniref:Serine aminopeptidase S33 domain-containing protein n=1 Tax=Polarella glacialis TaxID=89957 RepID=A0A813FXW1_POLGL|nr:unnamed protein product [Polarella glacialis]CAE8702074.1 unnamed protein product [Polarella glacialis]
MDSAAMLPVAAALVLGALATALDSTSMLPVVAAVLGTLAASVAALRWYLCQPMEHIETGAQRRALYPLGSPINLSSKEACASEGVKISQQIIVLADGTQMFSQVLRPTACTPNRVVVFFHGYTSHGDLYLEALCDLAREGAVVLVPDLPCHGRSDGLLAYIPDWFAWVDQVWEFLGQTVPPLRAAGKQPLKVFAMGLSMGGGLVACLSLQRPAFFDGLILVAPMLMVSEELKPSKLIQEIFKYVLKPALPAWPLTPSKPMEDFDFRLKEQGRRFTEFNSLGSRGCKPRLATAYEFVFVFPIWLEKRLHQLQTPFLVLHGAADKITDPKLSQRLYDVASSKDKQIRIYEDARHCELLSCVPGMAQVIETEWLPEQLQQTKTCIRDIAEWVAARS